MRRGDELQSPAAEDATVEDSSTPRESFIPSTISLIQSMDPFIE
jgi:hypothetical protein